MPWMRWLIAASTCIALAGGCAALPKPKPAPVPRDLDIQVKASPMLNSDGAERATPLVVRVYELRSPLPFQAADFFALFDKDQATLGNDMAGREELQLRPGETVTLPPRELKPDVHAVGVFAAFRDLEKSRWRAVMMMLPEPPPPVTTPPPKPISVPVRITLGARDVNVAAE